MGLFFSVFCVCLSFSGIFCFDMKKQITAFIHVVPQLMITAPEWTRIIHSRILNDVSACGVYCHGLELIKRKNSHHFIYDLLEESVINRINYHPDSDNLLIL